MTVQSEVVRRTVVSRDHARVARRLASRAGLYLLVIGLACVFMGPFLWTVGSSLKSGNEIRAFPPLLFPTHPLFRNYALIFQTVPLGQFFLNSTQVSLLAVLGQTVSATIVAYGFARFRFPGRDAMFLLVISTILLPREVLLIPTFLLFKYMGLLDTLYPLWIPSFFGGGAFTIFLLRQFLLTLPRDLDEAAKLDGANSLTILWRILVPLSLPAIATSMIFGFLYHWNDFLEPLIYLNSSQKFTVSLGLLFFQTLPNEGQEPRDQLLMAASLVVAAPCLVVFFLAQRYFVRGIVMSGIKG